MNLGLGLGLSFNRSKVLEFVEQLGIIISTPSESQEIDEGVFTFTGTVNGPNTITDLEYQIDGGAFTSFTVAENWTVDITLDPSNTSVTIRATDDTTDTVTQTVNFTVADTTSPNVASPALSTSSVDSSGWLVDFTKATDTHSAQTDLVYKLYISDTNNLDTNASIVEANGTLESQGTDVSTLSVSGLTAEVTKWFNIVVEDEAGNKSIYTQNSETTEADVTVPTSAPTIDTVQETSSGATISYTGVQDATYYEYRIDSGTAVDIGTTNPFEISNLNPETQYSLQMRSGNSAGVSDWSTASNFTTLADDDFSNSLVTNWDSINNTIEID